MTHGKRDNDTVVYGVCFYGAIVTSAIFRDYAVILIIAHAAVAILYTIRKYYVSHKCPHGVFKGMVVQNGQYQFRCSECEKKIALLHTSNENKS